MHGRFKYHYIFSRIVILKRIVIMIVKISFGVINHMTFTRWVIVSRTQCQRVSMAGVVF